MGIEKFLDDADELKIPKKDYKAKVDETVKTKFDSDSKDPCLNIIDSLNSNIKKSTKKIPMSIYFEEDDLLLLKAISHVSDLTVSNTVISILKPSLDTTKNSLPLNFDINKLAKDYDKKSKKKKST